MEKTIEQLRQENDALFAKINQQLTDICQTIGQISASLRQTVEELDKAINGTKQFVYGQQPEDFDDVMDFQECELT